ncbi:hypothetical protein LZ554_008247 [Drepanopeziza brunnea f. sp. 'monogermtubi']|nr:hypothetical protein LZ554_008247 [Drepanopeziza brunnea f. sp. 'monogermtubi']
MFLALTPPSWMAPSLLANACFLSGSDDGSMWRPGQIGQALTSPPPPKKSVPRYQDIPNIQVWTQVHNSNSRSLGHAFLRKFYNCGRYIDHWITPVLKMNMGVKRLAIVQPTLCAPGF